jgi:ribonuclease J
MANLIRIAPLGGVGEVGKNSTLIECDGDLLVVDAGVKFPEAELHGVDLVIPDFTYVVEHARRLRAVLITHGHEDHIGALPYLLMALESPDQVPIYGSRLSLGLIEAKLREHGLHRQADLRPLAPGERVKLGRSYEIEPVEVNHSIPQAFAFAIRTPLGIVFHTGDFKFDPTPVDGRTTDSEALRRFAAEGVLALLSDCVRVEQRGWTPSERIVHEALERIIVEAPGRVIVTTFASNLGRLREVIKIAHRHGRKTAVAGRSMDENLKVAREIGLLEIPAGSLIELRQATALPPKQLVLLTTGSQGEPTSVLSRIGAGDHPVIKVLPNDTVVYSASPVPGNEEEVARSIDNLYRRGARVIYRAIREDIHVSGHASQEELKQMIELLQPRHCVPLHGEYRMLVLYRELATEVGVPPENVHLLEIGDVLELTAAGARRGEPIPSGSVLVDGLTVGEVTRVVLRDRRRLAADGVIICAIAVDRETGDLVGGPDLVARGFVDPSDGAILNEARDRLVRALEQTQRTEPELGFLTGKVKEVLGPYIYEQTRLRPMILPVVTEV